MSRGKDFWSRRRARVEAEEQAGARTAQNLTAQEQDEAVAQKSDAELCADLNLPDPDAMQPGDDFSAFMSRAVPDRLRRRALRCLWRSNPVLANVDGLVDYGEDFTDSARVIENMQTAYQVGRGMTAHVEEMARQADARAEAEARSAATEVEDAEDGPEADEDAPETELAAVEELAADAAPSHAWTDDDAPEAGPPPRRRMHFAFDDIGASA